MMISKIDKVQKPTLSKGKMIQKITSRYQYLGATGDPKIEPVKVAANIKHYQDHAGFYGNKFERVTQYKEEYRHYYLLEQNLEDHYDEPSADMDFIDHLFVILTEINEVIIAVSRFDKAFNTSYSQQISLLIKNFETDLTQASILIHVDYTLGFFKGRMKKLYELHPNYFDFLVENNSGLIPMLISAFRVIKAIIPEKIDDISSKHDQEGAVIDHKL